MPKVTPPINNFNAGELSPLIEARFDVNKYLNGCRTLQNAIPLVEGGAKKMPGTYYIIPTKDSSENANSTKKARLVPFSYSTVQTYQLEFGDRYIRFLKDHGLIVVESDTPEDFDPSEAQYNGRHVKVGAYLTLDFGSGKKLYVAGPWYLSGTNTIKVAVATSGSDLLSVAAVGDTITISLAKTTSARNAAHLIQYLIRVLTTVNGVGVTGFTVTENAAYAAARPISGTISASLLVAHDLIYRCLFSIDDPGEDLVEFPITDITKANPGVVTSADNDFITYDRVHIAEVVGMLEVNDRDYTVGTLGFGTFQLYGIDTSGYGTYVSGGKVKSVNPNTNYFPPAEAAKWVQVDVGDPVEIVTTYLEAELFVLDVGTQSADVLYIFHKLHPPAKLIRHSHIDWELTPMSFLGTEDITKSGYGGIGKNIRLIVHANPAIVTVKDFEEGIGAFNDGSRIYVNHVLQMEGVNQGQFIVEKVTTSTFKLKDPDTGDYFDGSAYTGNGLDGWAVKVVSKFNVANEYPSCGTFFEQRLCLGGFPNHPLRINLSVSGDFENFISDPQLDDGAIQWDLVSSKNDSIRWMIGQKHLMCGTYGGVWRLSAATSGAAMSQTNFDVKKEIFIGAGSIAPQPSGDSIIWITRSANVVRLLQYVWESDKWIPPDLTRVARHITMGATRVLSGIIQTGFQFEPYPIFWAIRADGQLLGMTFEAQEQVYAWFRIVTDGLFESFCVTSKDNDEDEITVIVNRTIGTNTKRYIEYFKPQELFGQLNDSFFVHCGLTYDGGAHVDITNITKAATAVVTAPGHTFVNADYVQITEVVGMTQANQAITAAYTVANANIGAGTFELYGTNSSAWTAYGSGGIVKKVKKVFTTGFSYLEGKTLDILVDGAVHNQVEVVSGAITLDRYGNKIHFGLPYTTIIEPMKLNAGGQGTSRGKKQKINRATLCFHETVGGKYGRDQNHLFDIPFGTGVAPVLHTEDVMVDFEGDWSDEATISIVHDQPLPMTLKAIIPRVSVNEEQ